MATDKRKKGCPNEKCERHKNRIMLKASEEYCPKCGTRLIFVCSKCFREIEDIDFKHRECMLCDAEKQEKRKAVLDNAKKAGKAVAGLASPVIIGVGGKMIKDGQNIAIKNGPEVVVNFAKSVIKRG